MKHKSLQDLFKETHEQVTKFSLDGKVPTEVFEERLHSLEHQVDMLIEYMFSNEEDGVVSYRLQDGSLIQSNVKDLMSFVPEFGKVNNNVWDPQKFCNFVLSKIQMVHDVNLKASKPAQVLLIKKGVGILG